MAGDPLGATCAGSATVWVDPGSGTALADVLDGMVPVKASSWGDVKAPFR